jgi:hypothetical protein
MKTKPTNPNEDIQAIREIMERSSKFLSLSGLAGVFAGIIALTGTAFAWFIVLDSGQTPYAGLLALNGGPGVAAAWSSLALIAAIVLLLAVSGAVCLSYRMARKAGQKLWSNPTKNLLIHFLIPLVSGGVFILILIAQNKPELVPAAMLVFYGLSLVNAGKFTFGEIQSLGLTSVVLGLLAGILPAQGLLLWSAGFGLMHIIYGTVMYRRQTK